jgi:hypothetical protein
MTTRNSLSDAAYPRGGYSPLRSRPSPPARRISNRSYRRLEFNISPTKQRTGVLSNRSKSGVFWRQMRSSCRFYRESEERSLDSDSRPSEGNGQSRDARVFAQDEDRRRKAKKRLMETLPDSKVLPTCSQLKALHFLIATLSRVFKSPRCTRPNSFPVVDLWNLKSGGTEKRLRLSGATLRHRCHLFMAAGKTNSGLSTSKKAVRVVIVLEVYTPGRFLRRYL